MLYFHATLFSKDEKHDHNFNTMDYLRMDGKRGHVMCENRLAVERQESFYWKFAISRRNSCSA